MKRLPSLIRPRTFHPEGHYLYIEHFMRSGNPALPGLIRPVNFEAYDVCPAFIIVRNGSDKRWRCAREQLFISEDLL